MNFREAIQRDVEDLRGLIDSIATVGNGSTVQCSLDLLTGLAACGHSFREQELELDIAAWRLRQRWLALAHRPADATPKSPRVGQSAHIVAGDYFNFGYERDLDASSIESRAPGYMQTVDGWSDSLVLFRSGQAALAALLQFAFAAWGTSSALRVLHLGAYFETRALMDAWPPRVLERVADVPDLVIAEPVWCDGGFGITDPIPSSAKALYLDTTMSGPGYDVTANLVGPHRLVIAYSSGLKLDQAGLELANVGIVRIYSRDDAREVAAALRRLRALNGTSLTLDELSALSAPWFMQRSYSDRYTAALFDNNKALAQAVGSHSSVFEENCHPSLISPGANAPFCAIRLREPSREL